MEPQKKIHLGTLSDLQGLGWKNYRAMGKDLIVVWTPTGALGYINFCTHMGGKLTCKKKELVCGWHGAIFDPKTGIAKEGTAAPSGSKLKTIELEVEGNNLFYLHKEEKSPWASDF